MKENKGQKLGENFSENEGAKEPHGSYRTKRLIFSSLQEQEEDNYRYWLSLTPEQRIERATLLITHAFKDRPAQKSNRIIFDQV
jgi:uncharacterized protein (UPF0262 family)